MNKTRIKVVSLFFTVLWMALTLCGKAQTISYDFDIKPETGVQSFHAYRMVAGEKELEAEYYFDRTGKKRLGKSYWEGVLTSLDSTVYDDRGNLLEKFSISYHNGQLSIWNNYTYDTLGNLLSTLYISGELCVQEIYFYNEKGEKTGSSGYFFSSGYESYTESELKENGTVLLEKEYSGDVYSTTLKINNSSGRRYRERATRHDSREVTKRVILKDKQGRDLEKIWYEKDKKTAYVKYRYKEKKTKGGSVLKIRETGSPSGTKKVHEWYNEAGEITEKRIYKSGKAIEKLIYQRDSLQNVTEFSRYKDTLLRQVSKEFDPKNRLVKETEFNNEAEFRLKTETWTFDEHDNQTGYTVQFHPADGSGIQRFEYRYHYDAKGNWIRLEVRKNNEPYLHIVREFVYRK